MQDQSPLEIRPLILAARAPFYVVFTTSSVSL